MKKYNTVEEITEAFTRAGWNHPVFALATEADVHGCYTGIISKMRRGHKFFIMESSGNIYNDCGVIALYNVEVKK